MCLRKLRCWLFPVEILPPGENNIGYYGILKGFYEPADIPTLFQETIVRTLGHQIQVRLDDIIVVTRSTKEEQTQNLCSSKIYSVLTKLEKERYIASKKKKNSIRKRQYGSDIQSHKTESDPTKKKQTPSKNWDPQSILTHLNLSSMLPNTSRNS